MRPTAARPACRRRWRATAGSASPSASSRPGCGSPTDAAFDLLRRASNDRNVKLRALAEEVIYTGTLE
ncbi:ANTAR domain-containing protein [Geodermatophilus sp. SYSU D01105]